MADASTTIETLKDKLRQFAAEREWEQFHSPKNLCMGLAVEVAELMEHFLWIDLDASRTVTDDPRVRQQVADELADVANYVLILSYTLKIDLSEAIAAKVSKNALKYPVERVRGHYTIKDRGVDEPGRD